jgi:TldD protein
LPLLPAEYDQLWDAALLAAADLLAPRGKHAQLFLEDREDVRMELRSDGLHEAVHSRLRGLSARGGPEDRFEAALANPSPSDAARLARAARDGDAPRQAAKAHEADEEPRIDPRIALEHLTRLVEAAERAAGTARVSVTARWIAFDQRVRVARPGRDVVADARAGHRMSLEVRIAGRGTVGRAVGDRVLRLGLVRGLERFVADVVERAAARQEAHRAPRGRLPVVFAPGVGGILMHEVVGHALEADTVHRGASALALAVGKVAPKEVRIVDDPRRGRAAWRFDDEGAEARVTTLVRGGECVGLLHDQRSAAVAGVRPTGHGRRSSFQEPVRPRMGCTFLGAGNLDPCDVIEGIARGVYVRRMEAASVDTASGEAAFRVADADLIHRGRLDRPLKPFLLAVITREALSSLDRIASDLAYDTCIGSCMRDGQPLATSVGAPTFRMGLTTVIS